MENCEWCVADIAGRPVVELEYIRRLIENVQYVL